MKQAIGKHMLAFLLKMTVAVITTCVLGLASNALFTHAFVPTSTNNCRQTSITKRFPHRNKSCLQISYLDSLSNAPSSGSSANPNRALLYVLEGAFFWTDQTTGQACRCGPGDTLVLTGGEPGEVDVTSSGAKLLWTVAA